MIKHKSYMDINRFMEKYQGGFHKGDYIVVQEKIDGANASFIYDPEEDCIQSYSRKRILSYNMTLNGFWNFVQSLDKEKYKKYKNYRFFGEWLTKHTVKYPSDKYDKFYLFDIYDEEFKKYLCWQEVLDISKELGLETVPLFYEGIFKSWEDVYEYVGKTKMGGDYGEGIVLKSMTNLNSKNEKLPFYVKIVTEKFSEVKKQKVKIVDLEKLKEYERIYAIAETIVTRNRIEKMLLKFVDNGELRKDWDEKDLGDISRILPIEIYKDCVKEEKETVDMVGKDFGKICAKISMKIARDIVSEM